MKILYYYSKLNIGGAENSTVRLLNAFEELGHEVTLLLRWSGGSLENQLSSRIRVIHLKEEHSAKGAGRCVFFALETLRSWKRERELLNDQYDICISGLFGYNPEILFRYVRAKQYYQMLRNDVSKTGNFGKTKKYMSTFGDRFDAYIGVSKYTTESFTKTFPQHSAKAYTIYNILPTIAPKTYENPFVGCSDRFKIVTVCRLTDRAKGLFRMVNICRELKRLYADRFIWFIVGDGPDRAALEVRIRQAGLENHMILCGEQSDPLPYYHYADLVAVLSYYEGLCGVVNEAKMMERPVIATEFSGIHEQLTDGVNGRIVANNEEAILSAMKTILEEPQSIQKYAINGLPRELTDNEMKLRQFESLYTEIEERKNHAWNQCDHTRL